MTDCGTRASARREFEPFTQKHECDDRGRDFEVHADHAVLIAHCGWKYLWRNRRDKAMGIGDEYAETNQRVHVRRAVFNAAPSASVVIAPGPQHDRSGKNQLERAQDTGARGRYVRTHYMRQHCDGHYGHAQRHADPEFAFDGSDIAVIIKSRRYQWLKRHAADRTGPWARLAYLRMHRTRVDRVVQFAGRGTGTGGARSTGRRRLQDRLFHKLGLGRIHSSS